MRRAKKSAVCHVQDGGADIEPAPSTVRDHHPVGRHAFGEQREATKRQKDVKMVKRLMRTVIHPVAIVTAADAETDTVYGATISSFHTVSFDPEPVVSLNLRADSTTLKTILATGRLTISFPTNDFAGIELAQAFSKGNSPSPFVSQGGILAGQHHIQVSVPYPPAVYNHWRRHRSNNSGLAFALTADLTGHLQAGDHYVLTASVMSGHSLVTENYPYLCDDSEIPYFTAVQSLAYIHGMYTDRADQRLHTSLDSLARLEDPIKSDLEIPLLSNARLRAALSYYHQRIKTITEALSRRSFLTGVPEALTDEMRNELIMHIPQTELVSIMKSHRGSLAVCQAEMSKRRRYLFFNDQHASISTTMAYDELTIPQLSWIAELIQKTEEQIAVIEHEVRSMQYNDGQKATNNGMSESTQLRGLSASDANLIFQEVKALKAKGVVAVRTEKQTAENSSIDASRSDIDQSDGQNLNIASEFDSKSSSSMQPSPTRDISDEQTQTNSNHDPDHDELVLDFGEGDVKLDPGDLFILERPGEKTRIDRKLDEYMSNN